MRTQRPDEKTFKEWNEAYAEKYNMDNFYNNSGFIIRSIEAKRIRCIVEMLECAPGEKILEVGCGGGHILKRIKDSDAYGLDISDYLLDMAKKMLSGTKVKLVNGDAGSIPFKDKTYDKIYCTEVIEHVLDPKKVISEIARVGCKDCKVIVTVPNENLINKLKKMVIRLGLWKLFFHGKYEVSDEMNEEWHLHIFDLARLKELVKDHLVIEKVRYVPFRLLPLRYVVKCRKI